MRRAKEDMLQTRQIILKSAFKKFYEQGYESTTLADIVEDVGLTRGAVYWHFKNKEALFRAVVDWSLERANLVQIAKTIPQNLPLEDYILEILYIGIHGNKYIDFVYKMIVFVASHPEFKDVLFKIREMKLGVKRAMEAYIARYMQVHHITGKDANTYASPLFLIWEGMFLCKYIKVDIPLQREHMKMLIHHILRDIEVEGTGSAMQNA